MILKRPSPPETHIHQIISPTDTDIRDDEASLLPPAGQENTFTVRSDVEGEAGVSLLHPSLTKKHCPETQPLCM